MEVIIDVSNEGIPIFYNEEKGEVIYKNNKIPFIDVKNAVESKLDRVSLTNNLTVHKQSCYVEFGCLQMHIDRVKSLIKQYESKSVNTHR